MHAKALCNGGNGSNYPADALHYFTSRSLLCTEGGLISESFLFWLKSPKIGAKSLSRGLFTKEKILRRVDLAPFFCRFEPERENFSKIKLPLATWLHTAIKYHRQSLDSKKSIAQLTIAAISILIIIAEHNGAKKFLTSQLNSYTAPSFHIKFLRFSGLWYILFHRLIN